MRSATMPNMAATVSCWSAQFRRPCFMWAAYNFSCSARSIEIASTTLSASSRRGDESVMARSEEHTSELQSLMRISYAVFCLKKKKKQHHTHNNINNCYKK